MSEEEKILNVFENTGDFGKYYLGDYSNEDIAKFVRSILQKNKELENINDKLSNALNSSEQIIDKAIELLNNYAPCNPLDIKLLSILKGED